jgi:hypothetical protein
MSNTVLLATLLYLMTLLWILAECSVHAFVTKADAFVAEKK